MLLGPIFSLELVTSARRSRYFLTRAIYAVVLFLALWSTYSIQSRIYAVTSIHGIANIARDFFVVFSTTQLLAVMVLAPPMIAGTIAQERERRTLEYLLASELSSADIVLGKLSARLVHVLFVLLAGIPVLSLSMLLGGIPPSSLLLVTLVTVATLIVIAAMSILASVWARRPRDAVIRTYVVLFGMLAIPLLGAQFRSLSSGTGLGFWLVWAFSSICQWLAGLNPIFIVGLISSQGLSLLGPTALAHILWTLLGYLGFAAACTTIAVFALRPIYARSEGRAARSRWYWRIWRPALGKHPMLWKELFIEKGLRLGRLGRLVVVLILLSAAAWLVSVFTLFGGNRLDLAEFEAAALMASVGLACLSLLMCASRAATTITSEKERDSWTSLLSTPLSAREILIAKLWGSIYAAWPLALLVAALGAATALVDPSALIMMPFFAATWLLLLFYAGNLGLWCSQVSSTSTRAMLAALAVGLFFGGFYLMCCMPVMIVGNSPPGEHGAIIMLAGCIPVLLATPGIAWQAANRHASGPVDTLLVGFMLGMISYTIATWALWISSVHNFERLAGRTDGQPAGQRPRTGS